MTFLKRFLASSSLATFGIVVPLALGACSDGEKPQATTAVASGVESAAAPNLCAAIKGNGPRILAHFTSLARITEEFGVLAAASGGSSASITMFLYESMLLNPAVNSCGERACTDEERAARLALLLKSIHGYGEVVSQETGLSVLSKAVGKIKLGTTPTREEVNETVDALRRAMKSDIQVLLNTDEIRRLINEPNPKKIAFNLQELKATFEQFGRFVVPDNRVLFRVPIIDWDKGTLVFGKAADFYAGEGYGAYDGPGMKAFLDECALATKGKPWAEAREVASGNATCGQRFERLVSAHREAQRTAPTGRRRLDEPVGRHFRALVHSTAIKGKAVEQYKLALAQYQRPDYLELQGDIPGFAPSFSDLVYGYWAGVADSKTLASVVGENAKGSDVKSKKLYVFRPGTPTPWKYVLARSPAEPGIAKPRSNDDEKAAFTTGGWADALPTQVLRHIGCQNVLLVTRKTLSSASFIPDLASEFGAQGDEKATLFDDMRTDGVPAQSLNSADGVWCTDWDTPDNGDANALGLEGYRAPLLSSAPLFQRYNNVKSPSDVRIAGCTPGVAAGKP